MDHLSTIVARHLLTWDVALIAAAWATAAAGAVFHYWVQHVAPVKTLRGFARFLLPPELVRHPSCRRDALFAVFGHFTEPLTIVPLLVALPAITLAVHAACQSAFGHRDPGLADWRLTAATLAFVLLVQDFVTWFTHWVEHKSKIMWEVHKIHHSVEFLNPLSNRRHHPWQFVWESGLNNAAVGVVLGLASYIFRVPVLDNALLGVDAYFFASVLSCYHLRHSHIPLHYGWFEKYLLSPSQHQLHHSVEAADWDRNFGLLTSIWDRLFGTIRYSEPGYRYRIGLQPEAAGQYDRFWKLWTVPPVNIARIVHRRLGTRFGRPAPARHSFAAIMRPCPEQGAAD